MADVILTPNMQMPVPVPGQDPTPDWANNINACFGITDTHNHTPGQGLAIPPAGLNINSDLSFQNNNATLLRSVRFFVQPSPLITATDLGCLFVNGFDLWYTDTNGVPIRLTKNSGVNGTPGSISNLIPPAAADFVSLSGTFVWTSGTNIAANMDARSYILRNAAANSKGLTLQAPAAMPANFSITLPELPPQVNIMTMDSGGNIGVTWNVDNDYLQILSYLITPTNKLIQALNPSGAITMFGGAAAPAGYVLCDGASYLRTALPNLFTAIGTAYGTADATHFNVPDLRGKFPRGVSGTSGNDPDAASRTAQATGGNTGNNVGSIQADQFKTHAHTTPVCVITNANGPNILGTASNNAQANPNTSFSGGNETRPINVYVNYIIKT